MRVDLARSSAFLCSSVRPSQEHFFLILSEKRKRLKKNSNEHVRIFVLIMITMRLVSMKSERLLEFQPNQLNEKIRTRAKEH